MFAETAVLANVVVFPTEVTSPVRLALVVTLPAVRPEAVPVMLVPTKAEGVPKAGVTSVGEVDKTTPPVPVEAEVDPVPPLATGSVPVTLAVKSIPPESFALVTDPSANFAVVTLLSSIFEVFIAFVEMDNTPVLEIVASPVSVTCAA